MSNFATSAIILRKIDLGENDLMLTLLSIDRGKISVVAKSAKKSMKRFTGVLDLYAVVDIVCGQGRGRGLPILSEAVLKQPFPRIRTDIRKTAYAGYWAELTKDCIQEEKHQEHIYHLLRYALEALDKGQPSAEAISIMFQMRFLRLIGYMPHLAGCCVCGIETEKCGGGSIIRFDLGRGGVLCGNCMPEKPSDLLLSKGTIKQLLWVENGDLGKAERMRFTSGGMKEGLQFLERFAPIHLGRIFRSLAFLRQVRKHPQPVSTG
jgi:DNA repair protein RecO (recombination protein O)